MPQQSNPSPDENLARPRESALQQRLRRVNDLANQLTEQRASAQTLPASSLPAPARVVTSPTTPPKQAETETLPTASNSTASTSPGAIIFTLTLDDLIASEIYQVHHVPFARRQQRFSRLVWLAATICLSGVLILSFFLKAHWLILLILVCLAMFALTILLNELLLKDYGIKKLIEKLAGTGIYRNLLVQQQIIISEEGYMIVSPQMEVKISWQIVKQIAATDTHIYLFTSDVGANIIPKRALVDNTEIDTFIQKIQNYHHAARHQSSLE